MIYAYIRVSTDKQTVENQRFEILKYSSSKRIHVDEWIEETVSGNKRSEDRKLGKVLTDLKKNDILIVSELSRLGRNLMEVMSILNNCMVKESKVYAIKEGYELGNNISSKVLAFAFSLSAEIERNLISQRTKEAMARMKSEGLPIGRPAGSLSKQTKLTGKEATIRELLDKKVGVSTIGRILGVNRLTVESYIRTRKLRED
ncbi:master DNA invertase Mpi family serine-type recombinase [Arcticibacter eurypsychrophilus]|uniref:master DNA invertase Mpi family serine-type recombinase n=1 Tax=Arcticibacter eurypsychrophilus TaxID=1434752 RepID=UPI00084D18B4|nr:master DNA invertase Mpi family serine-type recombinase [Arcticibacter eurypsychrophilus]